MHGENASPIMTSHARRRAQARGVPMRILEAIYAHADRNPFVGDGRRSLMVSRRRLARLSGAIPAADRERMAGVALVVDAGSRVVITVLHVHGHRGRHYRRHLGRRRCHARRRPHWHPWRG
jgi:hypothetical protein